MTLAVGHITYANCVPFFHYLAACGFDGRIVAGVPSRLNALLAAGEIDLSPSSSFEYACHWRDYRLLPGHSISSLGPVGSVLLFSPRPLAELKGEPIALTGESATSVNLLKVLLLQFLGWTQIDCRVPAGPVEAVIAQGGAALLIGDRALRSARQSPAGGYVYDLGELWWRHTGLPFVYALWMVRQEAVMAHRQEVEALLRQLGESRRRAFADLPQLAAAVPEGVWLGQQALVDYWRGISYELSPRHLQGLQLFFNLCRRHGLLAETPELVFI